MKKSVKKPALLLAIVFVISTFTAIIPISAEYTRPTIALEASAIDDKGYVDVDVVLYNNPGVLALRPFIDYDSEVFTLVSVKDHEKLGPYMHSSQYDLDPYILFWFDGTAREPYRSNGVVATLTFEVNAKAAVDEYEFSLSAGKDDILDWDLTPISFDTVGCTVYNHMIVCGDCTRDGEINAIDLTYFQRYLAGWSGYDESVMNLSSMDTNGDGKINPLDGAVMARYIARWSGYDVLPYISDPDTPDTPNGADGDEYSYVVVNEFWDFDLGEIYLRLFDGGAFVEDALVTVLDGYRLDELSTVKFSLILSNDDYFYPGTIYTSAYVDGAYELYSVVDSTNYKSLGLLDAKAAYGKSGVLEFSSGSTSGDIASRIRTSSDTVFYFISDTEDSEERSVSVYCGKPDGASIEFDADTKIWVDKLGFGNTDSNGRASVVFVIDPVFHSGFFEDEEPLPEPEPEPEPEPDGEYLYDFKDVTTADPFYDAVKYVVDNGILTGIESFSPHSIMDRAMLAVCLGRVDGADESEYTSPSFHDVVHGMWYTPYVGWVEANGIMYCPDSTIFGVRDEATVEATVEAFANLYGYAEAESQTGLSIYNFSDADEVSVWAAEAMEWAVANGIYVPTDSSLRPGDAITRAEVATIIYNCAMRLNK